MITSTVPHERRGRRIRRYCVVSAKLANSHRYTVTAEDIL